MGRPKKDAATTIKLTAVPDDQNEDEAETDFDELRAMQEIDGATDIRWQISRVSADGGKKAGYVGELSTGDLSLSRIAEDFGAGRYQIKGIRQNGQIAKIRTVSIATEKREPPAAVTPPAGVMGTQELLLMMDEREQRRAESTRAWILALSPILAPIVANLVGGQKGPTLTDLTTALSNIKQVADPNSKSQVKEFIEMLALVREIQPEQESSKTGSTWVDVIRDTVGPMLQAGHQRAVPMGGQNAPAAATQVTPQVAAPQMEQNQMLMWVKGQVEMLVFQAARNKSPELYAELLVDNLPDGADPKVLFDFLQRPDWWTQLSAFVPGVKQHGAWFAECRKEILAGLTERMQPAGDATPPA